MTDRSQKPEKTGEESYPKTLGDFQIVREIGRGGMGVVYEAEQISLRRKVALKVLVPHLSLSKEAIMKFRREAEAGGRQHHTGIVSIYSVGEDKGVHYIAQELVEEGRTLTDKLDALKKEHDLPIGYFREAARLISEVADALQHAHTSGVIHRDIKPSNILLTNDESPRVTDFGLARVEDALALSRTGTFAGTPFYMSPEQAMSKRIPIDHRTDIYSLGVTLYEMLTLSRPFEGDTSQQVLQKILFEEPIHPCKVNPRVPRDLAVICLKAMEKKPNARYSDMSVFVEDLKRFLSGEVILARPSGTMSRIWKRTKKNPALSAAISVASLAVIALVVVLAVLYTETKIRNSNLDRLSDVKKYDQLMDEAETLWPRNQDELDKIDEWLRNANELVKNLPTHQERLNELREKTQFSKEGAIIFDNDDDQWEHDTLQGLVEGLMDLGDSKKGTIWKIENRREFAEKLITESIERYQEEWDKATASIAIHKKYNKLELVPQIGLVPLGQDPVSGLWEFAHLQTGKEVPKRGPDDQLELTEDMGLVFVLIPEGKFNMGAMHPDQNHPEGSPNVDPLIEKNFFFETPVHPVEFKEAFFLSKYEMTQGQWSHFISRYEITQGYELREDNPSTYNPEITRKDKVKTNLLHPVENVSWKEFDRVLSRVGLRLPSEAEWEYAARAGTTTVYWTGDKDESLEGAINTSDQACRKNAGIVYQDWDFKDWDDDYANHARVGTFKPNPFGLYNILGNLREYCQDKIHKDYIGAPSDGSAWETGEGEYRVNRGGDYLWPTQYSRCAYRSMYPQGTRVWLIGCRPARSISGKIRYKKVL